MALVPIILPQLGESIAEATIVSIDVKVGDQVETDQNVMEVETTKAATHVTSPTRGILIQAARASTVRLVRVAHLGQTHSIGARNLLRRKHESKPIPPPRKRGRARGAILSRIEVKARARYPLAPGPR